VVFCVLAAGVGGAGAGTQKWEFETGGDVYSSPAVSKNGTTIYVGSYDWKLYAIDAVTGAKKWEFETEGDEYSSPAGSAVYSSPALSNDGTTIYVGSYDNKLYAIDVLTGAKK
jgi:outer membrane protein assembly factor BamB